MNKLQNVIKKLYSGRLGRLKFFGLLWLGVGLFYLLAGIFYLLSWIFGVKDGSTIQLFIGVLTGLLFIPCFIFYFSLYARRVHDFNKPGWYALIILIPFGILYLLFKKGDDSSNKYGNSQP
ncbi:MAG: DUF805 domain-containing protein [Candidatus Yanofskybacteria bacterium]|nr:DUF805 domain-containing protein [Candidatus Yanofskybacteria bacterium]